MRVILVLLAVAACAGGRKVVQPTPDDDLRLVEIRVDGNEAIEDDDLIPGLAIERARRDGRAVDPYQLSLDVRRIRGAYNRLGFFDAKVTYRETTDKQKRQTVVFTVTEGPRLKARVAVTGLPPELSADFVLSKLELKEGAPWDYELYDDGKEVVKKLVEEQGYPFVDVENLSLVTVDRGAGVAVASYTVQAGPRATFGAIAIEGVPATNDLHAAILGRLRFRPGDPYSPTALVETTRQLYELGRFSQVRIDFDHDTPAPVVAITIHVTLASQVELRAGAGFGYEPLTYEARLRGGFLYIPDEHPLQSYSADLRIAGTVDHDFGNLEPKVRGILTVQRIEWLRPRLIGEISFGVDFFTVEAYSATGGSFRLGASSPLWARWLTMQAGWTISLLDFSGISDALDARQRVLLGLANAEINARFEQAIVAERRDNPIEPRSGYYLALRLTEGTLFERPFDYVEVQPDVRYYRSFGRRIVGAVRLRTGTFFGDVPITQRFFSGGAQSHRGFSARALSPVELNNVPVDPSDPTQGTRLAQVAVGGTALVETGAELRIPFGELGGFLDYGTTLFVDAADVTQKRDQLQVTHLHVAAGIGMFVKYGGFKIRVDMGHRLTRRASDGFLDNTLLFLGVGETY